MANTTVSDNATAENAVNKLSLKYYARECTFHGVAAVFDTSRSVVRRVLWAMLILAATGDCSKGFYDICIDYMRYDSFISTSKILKEQIDFPAVTICPPYHTERSQEYEQRLASVGPQNLKMFDKVNVITYTVEEFFYSCSFTGNPVNCSDYMTGTRLTTDMGCYTFHGSEVRNRKYAKFASTGMAMTFTFNKSAMVYIHGYMDFPEPGKTPMIIDHKGDWNIGVSKITKTALKRPHSKRNCLDAEEKVPNVETLKRLMETFSIPYSENLCLRDCVAHAQVGGKCSYWHNHTDGCTVQDYMDRNQTVGGSCRYCLPYCTQSEFESIASFIQPPPFSGLL